MFELDLSDPALVQLPFDAYLRVATITRDLLTLHANSGPPYPILKLIELLEATTTIIPVGDLERGVYGYAVPLDYDHHHKYAGVFLDNEVAPRQLGATLFHELGHVLLHILPRFPNLELPYNRQEGWPIIVEHRQAEIEADMFARLTMMPKEWIQQHWPYAQTATGTMDEAIQWMADLFSVPLDWMADRLEVLDLIRRD